MIVTKSEFKTPFYWTLATTLTLINFIVFIVSRSKFWITHPGQAWLASGLTENRTYLASEFERNLSCYQPLTCLRSGGAFFSQVLIDVITTIVELGGVNPDTEQKAAIILLVGMLWRILCISIFFISISRLLGSLKASLLLTNTLMLVLGGLPLWTFGRILVLIPLGFDEAIINRAKDAFYHMSYQELFFYDYGFIAIIPLAMFALAFCENFSKITPRLLLFIGFLTAMFYEAFVPLLFLSGAIFVWRQNKKFSFNLIWLIIGQAIWTVMRAFTIRLGESSDPISPYFRDTSLRAILKIFSSKGMASTKDSLPSIATQLLIVAFVTIVLGLVGAILALKLNLQSPVSKRAQMAIQSVTLATSIIIIGGYLTPKKVELGRQSLGLTVAITICCYVMTRNLLEKSRKKVSG